MDVTKMIAELKAETARTEKEVPELEKLVADLSSRLSAAETTLRAHRDSLEAMKMAIESLELMLPGRHVPEKPAPAPEKLVVVPETSAPAPKKPRRDTNPREIVKLNASGKQIGHFRSISQCAKCLGWTFAGTKKYIEVIHPDKQLRMKGFILKYAG